MSWTVLVPSDGLGLKEDLGMKDRSGQNDPVHAFTSWRWDRSVTFTHRRQVGLRRASVCLVAALPISGNHINNI